MINVTYSDQYTNQLVACISKKPAGYIWAIMKPNSTDGHGSDSSFPKATDAKADLNSTFDNVVILKVREFDALREQRQEEYQAAKQAERQAKINREKALRDRFWANVEETVTIAERKSRPIEEDFGSRTQYQAALKLYLQEIEETFDALGEEFTCTVADLIMYRWIFEAYEISRDGQLYALTSGLNLVDVDETELLMLDKNGAPIELRNLSLSKQITAKKRANNVKISYRQYSFARDNTWSLELEIPVENSFRRREIRIELKESEGEFTAEISQASTNNSISVTRKIVTLMNTALTIAEAWESR